MDDDKRIIPGLNDGESIAEMNRRHLKAALAMQQIAVQALAELRERELSTEECKQLLDAAMDLERAAAPGASRKRH